MSTTLTIHITKEVLRQSSKCSKKKTTNCAIAVAVRHIWPTAIICGANDNWFYKHNRNLTFGVHGEALGFTGEFDMASPEERIAMKPFSFDIEVPDEVLETINIDEVLKLANTVTRKEVLV